MSPIDELPAELYDEILRHLLCFTWEEAEHVQRYHHIPSFDFLTKVTRRPLSERFGSWPRPRALQLRLVSRSFNRAMLRVYFQYQDVVFSASCEDATERAEEHVINDGEGKRGWSLADAVEKLHVKLRPFSWASGSVFDMEHGVMNSWQLKEDRNARLDAGAVELKKFFDSDTLARATRKMRKLRSLVVVLNESWYSDQPKFIYVNGRREERGGRKVRLDLAQSVREGLARTFEPVESGKLHLGFLTCLKLKLPVAYDFAYINEHIPDAVALRLRELYLELIDATGPGGFLDHTSSWLGESDRESEEDYPCSNLQNQYPNTRYMHDMCSLINRCRNLESLGLVGTQCINLEGLDLRPAGLKNLFLLRVKATTEQLLTLLCSEQEGDFSNIEAINIQRVQLMDGTWEAVFASLLAAPSLIYVHVYELVYNRFGNSGHFAEFNRGPLENSPELWTDNEPDLGSLRDVIRAVQNRGGQVTEELQSFAESRDERDGTGISTVTGVAQNIPRKQYVTGTTNDRNNEHTHSHR